MARPRNRAPREAPIAPPATAAASGFLAEERRTLAEVVALWRPDWRLLLGLLAAALVTRFFNLSRADLWMDEIVIFREAFAGRFETVSWSAHSAHLGPVGFLLRTLGQTVLALRLWGALLGALAVPLTFLWARLVADKAAALMAALLVLANPFLLLYAQDGNFYGGMTFYTSAALLGYVLFFRGAPHAGLVLTGAASALNFLNHPIAAVPGAVMLGGMAQGVMLFPDLRRALLAWKPADWLRRPLVPMAGLALLVAFPSLGKALPKAAGFLAKVIDPGASSLTNVEFGWAIFRDHLTAFGINFYRTTSLERSLAAIPLALFVIGLARGLLRWRNEGQPRPLLALVGLAVVLPVASYALIFSLQLNRNFNLRYFTYLVPVFLFVLALAVTPQRRSRALLALGAIPLLVQGAFALRYLADDKANFAEGARLLKEGYKAGEVLLVPTRNDRVQSQFYLGRAGLPSLAPDYQYINQSQFADLAGGALPFALNGDTGTRLLSAWRHVEAPRLYAFSDMALEQEFAGHSRLGEGHDLRIARWDVADRVIYPGLPVRFRFEELTEANMVAIAGEGRWSLAVDGVDTGEALAADGPSRLSGAALRALAKRDGEALLLRPQLADSLALRFDAGATLPDHTKLSAVPLAGRTWLRNERDGGYEFLVWQPADAPRRQIVLNLARRDERDELLKKNAAPIPPGLTISVAIDGTHRGLWEVPSGAPEAVRLALPLELSPGTHRISVDGFQPRAVYTPYFPWLFQGIEWNAQREAPAAPAGLALSPGWESMPPASAWQVQGAFRGSPDTSLTAPAGDHPLRVDFPSDVSGNALIAGPPMPVQPDSVALFSFHYRLLGVERQEITPTLFFLDASGRTLGQQPANGANLRGSTLGGAWVRRQVAAPVPRGAAALVPAFQVYPYKGESKGGTFWVGSLAAPATEAAWRDPALPARYFP